MQCHSNDLEQKESLKDLALKTIEKIKKENICPKPAWWFQVKNALSWVLLIISCMLAALILSTLIYIVFDVDWDIGSKLIAKSWIFGFKILPIKWLLILLLLLMAAFLQYRSTRNGYRQDWKVIMIAVTLSVVALCALGHLLKLNHTIYAALGKAVSQYKIVTTSKEVLWNNPNIGLLGGTIVETDSNIFKLSDLNGWCCWHIHTSNKTVIKNKIIIEPEVKVKVIGIPQSNNIIEAKEIRPWEK